ncbi:hypothetical protein BDV93DRAFT_520426 [Ceratobasidium sp. AG-I]|nr:hypothetical protein BDV93DRAFT_520426 [Ceratobasidium sp. AG-I]
MIARAWILYDRRKAILVIMGLADVIAFVINIVVLEFGLQETTVNPNPAPDILSGCLINASITKKTWVAYSATFVLNTTVFVITARRSRFLKQAGHESPLIKRLLHDGALYYVFTLLILGFSALLNRDHLSTNISVGSGYLIALHSVLCSRMALSLHTLDCTNNAQVAELPVSETAVGSDWRVTSTTYAQDNSCIELGDMTRHTGDPRDTRVS